jgi:hypothetical protein
MKDNRIASRLRKFSAVSNIIKRKNREMRKVEKKIENYTLSQKICFMVTNIEFMLLLLSLTSVYYVSTGL